jgi:hypothetical protein
MIKMFSKLTTMVVIAPAALALVLSPTVSLATTATKVVHQLTRQTVQPQKSAADWDDDADGFYMPTRSPGWNVHYLKLTDIPKPAAVHVFFTVGTSRRSIAPLHYSALEDEDDLRPSRCVLLCK